MDWLWIGGKRPDQSARRCRNEALLTRYHDALAELAEDAAPEPPPAAEATRA